MGTPPFFSNFAILSLSAPPVSWGVNNDGLVADEAEEEESDVGGGGVGREDG
ncbi:hypothetical protein PM082_015721 [Marasmius tenuissimus]|nr:hypothetical protein PM082_015721 [Marasmius tenuissimus]